MLQRLKSFHKQIIGIILPKSQVLSFGIFASSHLGPFFGECKELNRVGPPKMMGLKKKKLLLNISIHTQKRKINIFYVSISK